MTYKEFSELFKTKPSFPALWWIVTGQCDGTLYSAILKFDPDNSHWLSPSPVEGFDECGYLDAVQIDVRQCKIVDVRPMPELDYWMQAFANFRTGIRQALFECGQLTNPGSADSELIDMVANIHVTRRFITRLAAIGKHAFVTIHSDGSGLINTDFTNKTNETEIAFTDQKQLQLILDNWKEK